ncbi:MAG: galactose-1-epimerase, partial [Lachnospiraceae bacterium]|nr:galactose-1-epimerase [Lachnospiraceae bacterium]
EQLAHTGGYDHNYALNGEGMRKIAFACGDISGVTMEVESDLPGVQFYAGNFISGEGGKDGIPYGVHEGFCLETQYFPNAVNVLAFESPKIEAEEKYHTVTRYHFGIR